MRTFHRWVGFPASLFLVIIGGTGVYMQGEFLWKASQPPLSQPPPAIATNMPAAVNLTCSRGRSDDLFEDVQPAGAGGTSGLVLVNL